MAKGRTLQDALSRRGSLSRAAAKLGCSIAHLCDIRSGKKEPSLDLALRISRRYGVALRTLIRDKGEAA
jgi:transcriptional regulator with XRE-family HTH domain